MQKDWYQTHKTWRAILLMPLSWVFSFSAHKRKLVLQRHAYKSMLPIIVVGNIAVGGTGKTPVVQVLCQYLQKKGYYPAIITRGFGGKAKHYPFAINEQCSPKECGDEPYMLSKLLQGIPIVVSPKRVDSVKWIESRLPKVNVIISDDGLQHYAMARDIEIAVVDGQRMFGNGLCLPAGPLREPVRRLKKVDFVIINGGVNKRDCEGITAFGMDLKADALVNIATGEPHSIAAFIMKYGKACYAIAGIGNPDRFFESLRRLGFNELKAYPFADHYAYNHKDFDFVTHANMPVVMTHKDAVKCQSFAKGNWYYLAVLPAIDNGFFEDVSESLSLLEKAKR